MQQYHNVNKCLSMKFKVTASADELSFAIHGNSSYGLHFSLITYLPRE